MKADAKPKSVRKSENRYAAQIQGKSRVKEEYDVTPKVTALCSLQVVSIVTDTLAPSAMNIINLFPAPAIGVVTKAPKLGCSIEFIIPAMMKSILEKDIQSIKNQKLKRAVDCEAKKIAKFIDLPNTDRLRIS